MPRISTRRWRGEPDPPTILVTPGEAAPHDCEWQSAREFERQRTGRALVGGSSPTLLTSHAHRSAPRVRGATRAAPGSRSWSGVGLALVSQASQMDARGSHLNTCILSSEDRIEPQRATLSLQRPRGATRRASVHATPLTSGHPSEAQRCRGLLLHARSQRALRTQRLGLSPLGGQSGRGATNSQEFFALHIYS